MRHTFNHASHRFGIALIMLTLIINVLGCRFAAGLRISNFYVWGLPLPYGIIKFVKTLHCAQLDMLNLCWCVLDQSVCLRPHPVTKGKLITRCFCDLTARGVCSARCDAAGFKTHIALQFLKDNFFCLQT